MPPCSPKNEAHALIEALGSAHGQLDADFAVLRDRGHDFVARQRSDDLASIHPRGIAASRALYADSNAMIEDVANDAHGLDPSILEVVLQPCPGCR
jgi:hypothetical protein